MNTFSVSFCSWGGPRTYPPADSDGRVGALLALAEDRLGVPRGTLVTSNEGYVHLCGDGTVEVHFERQGVSADVLADLDSRARRVVRDLCDGRFQDRLVDGRLYSGDYDGWPAFWMRFPGVRA